MIAAASGIAVWFLSDDEPVAEPAPRPDLLNGVYRVDYHWDQATYREAEGNTNWGEGADAGPAQDWLTLTSACTDTDCIATGEVLGQDRERQLLPDPPAEAPSARRDPRRAGARARLGHDGTSSPAGRPVGPPGSTRAT